MSSSLLNPSKYLTDLLSTYLEFDPAQLQLGIWSGDLSLKDVSLKNNAINPLLRNLSPASFEDKPPLHIKLLRSSIGDFQLRIPWKRLVWGAGDVHLEVSDVKIVLGFESAYDQRSSVMTPLNQDGSSTSFVQNSPDSAKSEEENGESIADDFVDKSARDEKQQLLREAERRQLQGLSLSELLGQQDRKDLTDESVISDKMLDTKQKGRLESYLKSTTSSILWRIFAGLKASIRKVRIVLVQDGVEVGVILHSLIVDPTEDKNRSDTSKDAISEESSIGGQQEDVVEKQVTKEVKVHGLGCLIRRDDFKTTRIPKELSFSTSVTADDYFLRPAELNIDFSIYYPLPDKERKSKVLSHERVQLSSSGSAATAETTDSSKARRGKRDRTVTANEINDNIKGANVFDIPEDYCAPENTLFSSPGRNKRKTHRRVHSSQSGTTSAAGTSGSGSQTLANGQYSTRKRHRRQGTSQSGVSSVSGSYISGSQMGAFHDSSTSVVSAGTSRHVKFHLSFGDLKTVCSSRQYELAHIFCASFMKMRNGRPKKTIRSVLLDSHGNEFKHSIIVKTPVRPSRPAQLAADDSLILPTRQRLPTVDFRTPPIPNESFETPIKRPIAERATSESVYQSPRVLSTSATKKVRLSLLSPAIRSERSQVVRSWWKYAYIAVCWELRRKKKLKKKFQQKDFVFDWDRQKYLRKEYVELYILVHLAERGLTSYLSANQTAGEELLRIEDELLIEQVLLYRSIARALRVRGLTNMPKSLINFRRENTAKAARNLPLASTRYSRKKVKISPLKVSMHNDSLKSEDDGGTFKENTFLSPFKNLARMSKLQQKCRDTTSNHRSSSRVEQELDGIEDPLIKGVQPKALFSPLSIKSNAAIKSPRDAFFEDSDRGGDMKTAKTFRTAKTSRSKSSQVESSDIQQHEIGNVVEYSFSLEFRSIDLMIYETAFTPKRYSSQLEEGNFTRNPSQPSSDDVSEISGFSDDFEELHNDETSGNSEEIDEKEIMLSSDFLLFGTPSSLLHLIISSVNASFRGSSGGDSFALFSVSRVNITGENDCHLLSSGQESPRDVDVKPVVASNVALDKEMAVSAALTFKEGAKFCECELSKIYTTIEMQTAMRLLEFSSTSVCYPKALAPLSPNEHLRNYLLKAEDKHLVVSPDSRLNLRLVAHGFETIIPSRHESGLMYSNSMHSADESSQTSSCLQKDTPHVKLSSGLIKFYSGNLVDDLRDDALGMDDAKTSFFSASGTVHHPVVENGLAPDLKMLNADKLLAQKKSDACHHWIIALNNLTCAVIYRSSSESHAEKTLNILESPVNMEMMLSSRYQVDLDGDSPKHKAVVEVSPVHLVVSEDRLQLLSKCVANVSNSFSSDSRGPVRGKQPQDMSLRRPARIEALSAHILRAAHVEIARIKVSFVSNRSETSASTTSEVAEVILEESITDFLSIISCFDLHCPVKDSFDSALSLCIDRLRVLGFTAKEAKDCVETARLHFLADIELMRRARTQVFEEYAEVQRDVADDEMRDEDCSGTQAMHHSSFTPQSDDSEENSDVDSAESMDIIDTTIDHAVEATIRAFLPLLGKRFVVERDYRELLVMDFLNGASLTMVELFYDSHFSFYTEFLNVSNGAGVRLLHIRPNTRGKHEGEGEECEADLSDLFDGVEESMLEERSIESRSKNGSSAAKKDSLPAILYSRFGIDKGYEFGSGGFPVEVLGSDDACEAHTQVQEKMDDVLLGDVELVFSQKLFEEIQEIAVISSAAFNNRTDDSKDVSTQSTTELVDDDQYAASLYVHSDSLSLLIVSDELAPFSRCNFDNIALRKGNQIALRKGNQPSNSELFISAQYFKLLNSTPEGQTYPEVISPLEEKRDETRDQNSALEIKISTSQDIWQKGTELYVTIKGARVFVVRQYVNELIQFFLSEEHGVGSLLSKRSKKDPLVDSSGNPPPPLIYSISILDCSIVLPRNSKSSEMLAIEAGSLLIFNSYHQNSFILPTEATPLSHGVQRYPPAAFEISAPEASLDTKTKPQNGNASTDFVSARSLPVSDSTPVSADVFVSARSSSLDADFHDALDGLGDTHEHEKSEVSRFDRKWISRINVQGSDLRIFTALAEVFSSSEAQNPRFHMSYGLQGRASDGGKVYTPRKELDASKNAPLLDSSFVVEKTERKWEEITKLPVEIEVIADYAPHLRLLIADSIGEKYEKSHINGPNPFSLDMKMSQFYLLLSVWYSNMQELPVLFPYSESQIKEGACAAYPPSSFPEYGTKAYVDWLKDTSAVRSEIVCHFRELVIRCSFDNPGYFKLLPESWKMMMPEGSDKSVGLRVESKSCFIHIANDSYGILRLGCGAAAFEVADERKNKKYECFLSIREGKLVDKNLQPSWPDFSWGLDCDGRTFNRGLKQPFQLSVFMTPGWALINFGAEAADAIMFDFSPIWILLDYFAGYFSHADYGSPVFEAVAWIEKLKKSMQKANVDTNTSDDEGLNIDFRLWLLHPHLVVPSSVSTRAAPCLLVESNTGFWFRLKSLGFLSSKEFGSTNLSLAVSDEFRSLASSRGLRGYANINSGVKTLIEGLSFGARYDWNDRYNHTSVSVRIPFIGSGTSYSHVCGITSRDIDVEPIILQPPKVCSPVVEPDRHLGPTICEITLILELFPVASSLFMNLLTGPSEDDPLDSKSDAEDEVVNESTYDVCADIRGLRLFLLDPVLGMHLPIAVLSVSSIFATASKFRSYDHDHTDLPTSTKDLQVVVDTQFWADYFKLGVTRSWEPLFEPYKCLILHEKSSIRGQGLSLESTSPLQLNVTGALLVTLDAAVSALHRSVSETFGDASHDAPEDESRIKLRQTDEEDTHAVFQDVNLATGDRFCVSHQAPKPLNEKVRVAFSFRNMTGQRIRVHQPKGTSNHSSDEEARIIYLRHMESAQLVFQATMSVVRNLGVVEVPFPGLENSAEDKRISTDKCHTVDMQLPGFQWLQGISVDSAGRRFDNLCPRSPTVLLKVKDDWRLSNALKVLTEVGLENGGRLITARSPFEVRNNTSHAISLTLNPDPTHSPKSIEESKGCFLEQIEPGESFQIPTLLLESSLHLDGSHLGCFWIRPDDMDEIPNLLSTFGRESSVMGNDAIVGFCSRPIQIAKIVHESAVIFSSSNGEDLPSEKSRSGVQVSCPISGEQAGISVAPFCYVIEVRRSPLTRHLQDHTKVDTKESSKVDAENVDIGCNETSQEKNPKVSFAETNEHIHGPVAYSLIIHPPLIIENLLPQGGRFELTHASRRTVLWFADLKPGERIPVHNVGLDAPLLLSVNLGFCRTPVGEGALVHHGSAFKHGNASPQHVGFKTIGKAMSKGTKQIGKTLTAISDSPDRRGQIKMALFQNEQANLGLKSVKMSPEVAQAADPLGFETDSISADADRGKVHRIESRFYTPDDVASETTVVDSIGQRLTLNIENVRGGGGQRRISLYAPFWIVNTTQYSLRYKQEKSSVLVSGTVISSTLDGSKPVDGSSRDHVVARDGVLEGLAASAAPRTLDSIQNRINKKTIFSGTPGALSTPPGRNKPTPEAIAQLLEKDLSLETLSEIAFMFNFNEDALLLGHQKFSVQLGDAESHYTSDWSSGFSLDSVGVNQIVGMHCKEGRALEISATISVAPGILSNYTKIVRFTPRYILVNQLQMPVRLWQDSSLLHNSNNNNEGTFGQINDNEEEVGTKWLMKDDHPSEGTVNQYESLFGRPAVLSDPSDLGPLLATTAHRDAQFISAAETSTLVPFHLPDTRGERQIRVDVGYPWNLTPSFSSDIAGEYTLRITRATDLRLIRHVTTRASPQYTVSLPPPEENEDNKPWDGELGVWFETDWGGDKRVIVKGTKRGRYSFNHTDVHVGDELLYIDGQNVSQMSFAGAMKFLKERIAHVALLQKARKQGLSQDEKKPSSSAKRKPRRQSRLTPRLKTLKNSSNLLGSSRPILPGWEDDTSDNLVLTFRTVEERLRRVRAKAAKKTRVTSRSPKNTYRDSVESAIALTGQDKILKESESSRDEINLKVDMRMLYGSTFVVVRGQDPENPPFRIENRSRNHAVFFRQRGCLWHSWNSLKPGESRSYSWEEPLKPKKLAVKVGANNVALFGREIDDSASSDTDESNSRAAPGSRLRNLFLNVDNEERGMFGATKFVKLEEIGFKELVPCPGAIDIQSQLLNVAKYLQCQVDTDGAIRVLVISDRSSKADHDELSMMETHLSILNRQIKDECEKIDKLKEILSTLPNNRHCGTAKKNIQSESEEKTEEKDDAEAPLSTHSTSLNRQVADNLSTSLSVEPTPGEVADVLQLGKEATEIAELPEETSITRCNQVIVQVLEANGLKSSDFSGLCTPYCEIRLKGRQKRKGGLFANVEKLKTYYVEKTLSPKWSGQVFVFDVPPDAVNVTRGHSIRIRVRNFRLFGHDREIGQTSVHFRSLRNQRELEGWYPLMGRTGNRDLEISNFSRGSIKLRVQWIYTVPALVDYFVLMSERRLGELQQSLDGMVQQRSKALESDRRRKEARDPFAMTRLPKILGLRKSKFEPRESDDDSMARGSKFNFRRAMTSTLGKLVEVEEEETVKKPLGQENLMPLNQTLKKSSKGFLWMINSRTAQSKLTRRQRAGKQEEEVPKSSLATEMARERLTSISEMSHSEPKATGTKGDKFLESALDAPKSPYYALMDFNFSESPNRKLPYGRTRSDSLPTFMQDALDLGGHLESRVRSFSRDTFIDGNASLPLNILMNNETEISLADSLPVTEEEAAAEKLEKVRLKLVKDLYDLGLVYHVGGYCFHRQHLSFHLRKGLLAATIEDSAQYNHLAKSNVKASLSMSKFKSWTAAQAVMNDATLCSSILGDDCTGEIATASRTIVADEVKVDDDSLCDDIADNNVSKEFCSPDCATTFMRSQALSRARIMSTSRNQFERACKRTLKSVLNPGGILTIRPLTALNLPDTFSGLSVRVRYGSLVMSTNVTDARVSPKWANEDSSTLSNASRGVHEASGFRFRKNKISKKSNYDENDLPFYIEPLQTSGSLRLSIIGERLNSKIEIGVLVIPIGSAISCCIEEMYDTSEDKKSGQLEALMYTRWFPLMSPKESERVEGDMGLSTRPTESEQSRNNQFSQYFTSCIKLAIIWDPETSPPDSDVDESNSKEQIDRLKLNPTRSPATKTYFNADIGRVSVAIIDSQRAMELVSISTSDIDFRYSVTKAKTRFSLAIGWIQVDQQSMNAKEPVVLAPTPVAHPHPTLQFLAVKDNLRTKNDIVSYQYIAVALQEMDLTIEEAWMFDLWDFFVSVIRRREVAKMSMKAGEEQKQSSTLPQRRRSEGHDKSNNFGITSTEALPPLWVLLDADKSTGKGRGENRVYVEELVLGFIKLHLTYVKGSKKSSWEVNEIGDWVSRTTEGLAERYTDFATFSTQSTFKQSEVFLRWSENTHDEDLWTEGEGTEKVAYSLPNTIASVFPSVSDARIRLQGKVIAHVFESPGEIIASIQNYYVTEILKQIYKIVGSLDFVGNPTMVLNSFATGVRDFIVAPSKAFMQNPKEVRSLGVGVAKGTLSLVSHSASGLCGFGSKIFAYCGQTAAQLSCDDKYTEWHRETVLSQAETLNRRWKTGKKQNLRSVVGTPLQDIVLGCLSGVTGIIVSPYNGLKKGEGVGFAKGIAVGTVGIVVRPLVGILDAFSHFSGSIYELAKRVNLLEKRYEAVRRLRLPYAFGMKNVLDPFDPVTARSVYLLQRHTMKSKKGKTKKKSVKGDQHEVHVASEVLQMESGVETYIVATTERIVLFKVQKEDEGFLASSRGWEVEINPNTDISSSVQDEGHNGVALTIAARDSDVADTLLSSPVNDRYDFFSDDTREQAVNGVPQSQVLYDTVTQTSGNMIEVLGTAASRTWDEGTKGEVRGDVREWFRVLGEFQHRPQLSRMHNAICCITGNLEALIKERGLSPEGSTRGYTAFGLNRFGSDILYPEDQYNKMLSVAIETIPWVPVSTLADVSKRLPTNGKPMLESRDNWLLSDEMEASAREGGPSWMVEARARAQFVAPEKPPLPFDVSIDDEIIGDIFGQLDQGNISYQQARELVDLRLEKLASERKFSADFASTDEDSDSSEASSQNDNDFVTARYLSPRNKILKDPQDQVGRNVVSDQIHFDVQDDSAQSQTGKIEKAETHNFAYDSETKGVPTSMKQDNLNRALSYGAPKQEVYSGGALVKAGDQGIPDEESTINKEGEDDESHWDFTNKHPDKSSSNDLRQAESSSLDARLDRLEAMMQQLLMRSNVSTAQPATRDFAWANNSVEREIADLRNQLQEQRRMYEEALATAALRQEVADLRREIAGVDHRSLNDANSNDLRREVGLIKKQVGEIFRSKSQKNVKKYSNDNDTPLKTPESARKGLLRRGPRQTKRVSINISDTHARKNLESSSAAGTEQVEVSVPQQSEGPGNEVFGESASVSKKASTPAESKDHDNSSDTPNEDVN